jgi:hypothetical protein
MNYLPEGASRFDYIHGDEDDSLVDDAINAIADTAMPEYKDSTEQRLDRYSKFLFSEDSYEEEYVYSAEHMDRVNSVIDGLFKR